MEGELKSFAQELAQHRHLLIEIRLDVTRRRGKNVVAVGIGPRRSAGDSSRAEAIGGCYQRIQREAFGIEPVDALHPDVPAQRSGIDWLDGRDFERVEPR